MPVRAMEQAEYSNVYQAEAQHWWYRATHELVIHYVRQVRRADLRILDAGCGTGGLLQRLRAYGEVEGLDVEPAAVAFCHARGLDGVCQADLNTWSPHAERYDVVTSVDVLYHQAIADDAAVLRTLQASLKSGGLLILHLPAFECLRRSHDVTVATRRRYTTRQVRRLLTDAGFIAARVRYRLPLLFILILLRKWLHAGARSESGSDLQVLPGWLNAALLALARLGNTLLYCGLRWPCGSSIIATGRKPL